MQPWYSETGAQRGSSGPLLSDMLLSKSWQVPSRRESLRMHASRRYRSPSQRRWRSGTESPALLFGAGKRADMKTVYFVRHGSTEGNEQRAYQHLQTPLSELGRRQVEVVARRFERIPVDIVIT